MIKLPFDQRATATAEASLNDTTGETTTETVSVRHHTCRVIRFPPAPPLEGRGLRPTVELSGQTFCRICSASKVQELSAALVCATS